MHSNGCVRQDLPGIVPPFPKFAGPGCEFGNHRAERMAVFRGASCSTECPGVGESGRSHRHGDGCSVMGESGRAALERNAGGRLSGRHPRKAAIECARKQHLLSCKRMPGLLPGR